MIVTVGDVAPIFTATRADDGLGSGAYVADDGSGFGLNIAHEIATAISWDRTVTESRDGGTRFEVTGVDVE